MNKMKTIAGLLVIFVTLPIWCYLLYQILVKINATELMFFLFWIYVPAMFFASCLARVASGE